MIYYFLFLLLIYYLFLKKIEHFEYNLCKDNYSTCLNYNTCCNRKNFYKNGNSKKCIDVYKFTNKCNKFKSNKINLNNTFFKSIHIPGYSYKHFDSWENNKKHKCYGKNNIPSGIIDSKDIYNSADFKKQTHEHTSHDHFDNYRNKLFKKLETIVYNKIPDFWL